MIELKKIERLIDPKEEDEDNGKYDWYDVFMMCVVVVSLLPLTTRSEERVFWYLEIGATVIFIFDYLMRWVTAPLRSKRKGWAAYLLYPFKPSAIIDLVTILPVFVYLNPTVRVMRIWRLVRILRVVRLFRYYQPLQTFMEVFKKKLDMLLVVLGFAVFYILITALIMFNVEDPEIDGRHFFDSYWDAVYWATCTLTTVGYGDVYPISNWGRVISMLSAVVGIAIVALPSGILTQGYIEVIEEEKARKEEVRG